MENIPSEYDITHSENDIVKLTSHKVRYQDGYILKSFMLDQISGIEVKYTSQPWFILLCIASIIGAVVFIDETDGIYAISSLIMAVISFFLYLYSRKHIVMIGSSSTKITFHTKGMDNDNVLAFVNKIEAARAKFVQNGFTISETV